MTIHRQEIKRKESDQHQNEVVPLTVFFLDLAQSVLNETIVMI